MIRSCLLSFILLALPAGASSCLEISICAAYSTPQIGLIFRGEVLATTPGKPLAGNFGVMDASAVAMESVQFHVLEAFKGQPPLELTINARAGIYRTGSEYLVYTNAAAKDGALSVNGCVHGQSVALDAHTENSDLQLLRSYAAQNGTQAGKGTISGRLYLRGPGLASGVAAPLKLASVTVSLSGPVNRSVQAESGPQEFEYLFKDVPPGKYSVAVKSPQGTMSVPADLAGHDRLQVTAAPVVEVSANSCREQNWFLRLDSHIKGRVTDAAGHPVAGAPVGLIARGTNEAGLLRGRFAPQDRQTTDGDGRYDFGGLNPGDYTVVLHEHAPTAKEPFSPVFYPAKALPSDGAVLHLEASKTLDAIDFVQPTTLASVTVHVQVNRANGTPIENATVIVSDPASSIMTAASARTDASGRVDVHLFGGREYDMIAATPDPSGVLQESPQCAGPKAFVASDGANLEPLVPDTTWTACRTAAWPRVLGK